MYIYEIDNLICTNLLRFAAQLYKMSDNSPTSYKQSFDMITPESEEIDKKLLWGFPIPPFVSDKVVTWVEENFQEPAINFKEQNVMKKVHTLSYFHDYSIFIIIHLSSLLALLKNKHEK